MSEDAAAYIGQLSADKRWRWDGTTWLPALDDLPSATMPAWLSLKLRSQATWTTVVVVLLVGLIADQFLRAGAVGLGASATFGSAAVILVFVGRISRLEPRLLAAAAVLFGTWLSLRASPWLLVPDIAVALVLLGIAASLAMRGSVLDIGIAESIARGLSTAIHGIAGAAFVVCKPIVHTRSRISVLAPIARGLVIPATYPTIYATIGSMNRIKISVTVDPTLLKAVDDFVERHEGADRSKVIDQALNQWSAAQQEEAMVSQYFESPGPSSEREFWRSTRRAAAIRTFSRG